MTTTRQRHKGGGLKGALLALYIRIILLQAIKDEVLTLSATGRRYLDIILQAEAILSTI